MNSLFRFINSPSGRIVRIIAGVFISYYGFFVLTDTLGIIVGIIGLLPIYAGLFNKCLIGPLFGKPFDGNKY